MIRNVKAKAHAGVLWRGLCLFLLLVPTAVALPPFVPHAAAQPAGFANEVTVGTPPTVTILTPSDGIPFVAGDTIVYSGSGFNSSGNPLPADAYAWNILFHHETHVHPAGGPFPGATGAFTIPSSGHDFGGATNYEFVLTVTDADGLVASSSVRAYPNKVNVTFNTQPRGLPLDVDGGARSHTITVPAVDSSWVATYAPSAISTGLVAAYDFSEGTGSTTADRSGYDNTGTLVGATWTTQGRFGKALRFNGTSSRVTVPDSPVLHLTSAMTLEAWVYPTATLTGWTDVIMKQGDDYYMTASGTPGGRPAAGSSVALPLF